MCTGVLLIALAGSFAPGASPAEPTWVRDYDRARQLGRDRQKPLAVFLGSGPVGWRLLSRDGRLGDEAKRILAAEYICVYVDTNAAAGKRLAAAFEIQQGPGIVISDATGNLQAFRHAGELAGDELVRRLRRYAAPGRVVRSTEGSREAGVILPAHYAPPPAAAPSPSRPAPAYPVVVGDFTGGGRRDGC
jgi:hypothetical protein